MFEYIPNDVFENERLCLEKFHCFCRGVDGLRRPLRLAGLVV